MHSYYSNNAVTLLKAAKNIKIRSIMNFKNCEIYPHFVHQPVSQPAVRPGCSSATALEFLHNKGNCIGFLKLLLQKCLSIAPWCLLLSLLVSFHLQIIYTKVRNLQKVLINL